MISDVSTDIFYFIGLVSADTGRCRLSQDAFPVSLRHMSGYRSCVLWKCFNLVHLATWYQVVLSSISANVFFESVPRSRSSSRDRKRGRWEEERDRRSESSSGLSRERSYSSIRSRDSEEVFADRDRERERDRDREKEKEKGDDEKEEEELLKPAWIRCTHAENYYSNDPMDQVVLLSSLHPSFVRFLIVCFNI